MRITLLAFPRVQLLDIVGPADVFAEAARQLGNPRAYRVEVIGTDKGMIKGSSGLKIGIDETFETYKGRIDTLLVAGSPHIDEIAQNPLLQDWLRRQAKSVRRIGSVCSGAFLLAAAGLLDGRRVTTHWNSSAKLARENPQAQVDADSIFIKDGNVYTSAGVTAGMDLALALVEQDQGRAAGLGVAKRLVVFFKRAGGQRQFSSELLAQADPQGLHGQLTAWLRPRLRQRVDVGQMAAAFAMSVRTLHRRLQQDAGLSPAQLLLRLRMEAACALLERPGMTVKQAASRSGFGSEYNLRRAFAAQLGVVPSDYQARFG